MSRTKLSQNYNEMRETWKSGASTKFKLGDVCRGKNSNSITRYVIIGPAHHIGKYDVKSWYGPKPWDYNLSIIDGMSMTVVDEPNPTQYNLNDRYPGPSSEMMRMLSKQFLEKRSKEAGLTFEEKEKLFSLIDEELTKKRKMDNDVISVAGDVDEEDDDDDFIPDSEVGLDPVEKKRMELLEND